MFCGVFESKGGARLEFSLKLLLFHDRLEPRNHLVIRTLLGAKGIATRSVRTLLGLLAILLVTRSY